MENKPKVFQLNKFPMDFGRLLLMVLIPVFRVKKIYLCDRQEIKNLGAALIAANHTGMTDPFILNASFWYRRFFYTASEEIMTGFRGKLLKGAGCIRIDRTIADYEAIKKCVSILKEGYLLGIFPQGHIGGEGMKGGVVLMSARAGVPIVPTHIERRAHWWQRHRVVFGQPIRISDVTDKKLPGVKETQAVIELMEERYEECRNGIIRES